MVQQYYSWYLGHKQKENGKQEFLEYNYDVKELARNSSLYFPNIQVP